MHGNTNIKYKSALLVNAPKNPGVVIRHGIAKVLLSSVPPVASITKFV